jgi:hypothetical protein
MCGRMEDDPSMHDESVVDNMPEYQVNYLMSMLERNVFFYPRHLWMKAIDAEILDRGLVRKNDNEHKAIVEIVTRKLEGKI